MSEDTTTPSDEIRIKELEEKVAKLETMLQEWNTYKNSAFYQQAAAVESQARLRPQRKR